MSIVVPNDEKVMHYLRNYLGFKVTIEELRTGKNTYVPESHKFFGVPYVDTYDYRAKTKKEWDEILEKEELPYVLKIVRECKKNTSMDLVVECIPVFPEERIRTPVYNLLSTIGYRDNYSEYYVNIRNTDIEKSIPENYVGGTMLFISENKCRFRMESI